VIGAGAGLGHFTTEGGYLYPNAKVVQIDTSPHGLWQGLRTADLHIHADARATAETISRRLQERGIRRPAGAATRLLHALPPMCPTTRNSR